jgi:hypothetical protein
MSSEDPKDVTKICCVYEGGGYHFGKRIEKLSANRQPLPTLALVGRREVSGAVTSSLQKFLPAKELLQRQAKKHGLR